MANALNIQEKYIGYIAYYISYISYPIHDLNAQIIEQVNRYQGVSILSSPCLLWKEGAR